VASGKEPFSVVKEIPKKYCTSQNVHAIGDRANGLVLDAFEAALNDIDVAALRPRLEHAQLMTEEDMVRLGQLGGAISRCYHRFLTYSDNHAVIASVQPTHV
jgi:predicted amidohydrolase YtcJ